MICSSRPAPSPTAPSRGLPAAIFLRLAALAACLPLAGCGTVLRNQQRAPLLRATGGLNPMVDVQPRTLHQRTTVILGSSEEVDHVLRHL